MPKIVNINSKSDRRSGSGKPEKYFTWQDLLKENNTESEQQRPVIKTEFKPAIVRPVIGAVKKVKNRTETKAKLKTEKEKVFDELKALLKSKEQIEQILKGTILPGGSPDNNNRYTKMFPLFEESESLIEDKKHLESRDRASEQLREKQKDFEKSRYKPVKKRAVRIKRPENSWLNFYLQQDQLNDKLKKRYFNKLKDVRIKQAIKAISIAASLEQKRLEQQRLKCIEALREEKVRESIRKKQTESKIKRRLEQEQIEKDRLKALESSQYEAIKNHLEKEDLQRVEKLRQVRLRKTLREKSKINCQKKEPDYRVDDKYRKEATRAFLQKQIQDSVNEKKEFIQREKLYKRNVLEKVREKAMERAKEKANREAARQRLEHERMLKTKAEPDLPARDFQTQMFIKESEEKKKHMETVKWLTLEREKEERKHWETAKRLTLEREEEEGKRLNAAKQLNLEREKEERKRWETVKRLTLERDERSSQKLRDKAVKAVMKARKETLEIERRNQRIKEIAINRLREKQALEFRLNQRFT